MSETAKRNAPEMRYLLGNLSEDEKTRLEEGYFSDDTNFEAVELAEDELIDAYVRNYLSLDDQQQFRSMLLRSPRLRERVTFARALAEKADSFQSPEPSYSTEPALSSGSPVARSRTRWWQGLFAQQPALGVAIAVVLIVANAILIFGWLRARKESGRLAVERDELQQQRQKLERLSGEQQRKADQLVAELEAAQHQYAREVAGSRRANDNSTNRQSSLSTVASLLLLPGSSRGSGAGSQLAIGTQTTTARLNLALANNYYATYIAQLKTAEGKVIFRKQGLKPNQTPSGFNLLLSVPVKLLTPNDYVVHLDGSNSTGQVESVNDYAFRVVR